jgi:hypothetical protein
MPYHLCEEDRMRYRLAANVDLRRLCDQALRLQEIQDTRGNSIILAIGEDRIAVTLAYAVRPKPSRAVGELDLRQDGQG